MSFPTPEKHDLDLGSGVYAAFMGYAQERHPDAPDKCGVIISHPAPTETGRCGGAVFWWRPVGEQGPVWTLNSLEPLDLSPSIRCKQPLKNGEMFEFHGYIKQGRWVAA